MIAEGVASEAHLASLYSSAGRYRRYHPARTLLNIPVTSPRRILLLLHGFKNVRHHFLYASHQLPALIVQVNRESVKGERCSFDQHGFDCRDSHCQRTCDAS